MNYNSQQIRECMERKRLKGESLKEELKNPNLTQDERAGKENHLSLMRKFYQYWKDKLDKMESSISPQITLNETAS